MKNAKLAIGMLLLCALNAAARRGDAAQGMGQRHHLMPVPSAVQFQSGRLKIDAAFTVAVVGPADTRLEAGIQRAARRLEGRTGFPSARPLATDARAATRRVECRGPGLPLPSLNEDESYTL